MIWYENFTKKMPQPLEIVVEKTPWEIPLKLAHSLQGIVSINMIHVANQPCTGGLYKESRKLLIKVQFLIFYRPFKICKDNRSESNYFFDNSLKMQNNL